MGVGLGAARDLTRLVSLQSKFHGLKRMNTVLVLKRSAGAER